MGCTVEFMLRKKTLVSTLAPASRHTLAAATSNGAQRFDKTQTLEHAERWTPFASTRKPQRHRATAKQKSWYMRTINKTQNCSEVNVVSLLSGKDVKCRPPQGPLEERRMAALADVKRGTKAADTK